MNKLKIVICAVILCLSVLTLSPTEVLAAGPIETEKPASLTLQYQYDGIPITGARFDIYYLASVDAKTNFNLTEQFAKYPIRVEDNTVEEWNRLAETLKGFTLDDKLQSLYSFTTDNKGKHTLNNLKTGLYLLIGSKSTVGDYTYTVQPTILCLPNLNYEKNVWDYDITIYPKAEREKKPTDNKVTRKVLKVWDDKNYSKNRPKEITIRLLSDGEVYSTVKLNASSNWRYTWDNLPAYDKNGEKIEWTLVETPVTNYTVNIEQTGVTFVVRNTYTITVPDDNPPEGDPNPSNDNPSDLPHTGLLWWPVPILLCFGIVFLVVGIVQRRRNDV